MRTSTLCGLLVAALVVLAARTGPTAAPTVPCHDIIGQVNSGRVDGYRIVLGVVSVPRPRLQAPVHVSSRPWIYWTKAGINVRAGRVPVRILVPRRWRRREAITWGNETGIVSALRIAPCPSPPKVWNAYSGGFYLRSRSACVPLTFCVGERSRTVRFGIGIRCR